VSGKFRTTIHVSVVLWQHVHVMEDIAAVQPFMPITLPA